MNKKLLIALSSVIVFMMSGGSVMAEEDGSEALSAAVLSPTVSYQTHIENIGWEVEDAGQAWKQNGEMSGTSGRGLRLEGIKITIDNDTNLGIRYQTHIQNIGWEAESGSGWKTDGEMSGTKGMGYRLEAIQIKLTGSDADQYDMYYQVHAQNMGWLGWARNGESAGTAGYGYRLEGIRIVVIKKGEVPAVGNIDKPEPFYEKGNTGLGNTPSNYVNGGWGIEIPGEDIIYLGGKCLGVYKNNSFEAINATDQINKNALSYSNGWLYYNSSGSSDVKGIYRRRLDNYEIQKLYSNSGSYYDLKLVIYNDELYFTADSSLYKLNPENPDALIRLKDSFSGKLAFIDHGYIYSKSNFTIDRMKMGSNQQETIVLSDTVINNFVSTNDHIYYLTKGKIYRANLDGSESVILIDPSGIGTDIILNIHNDQLFYAITKDDTITLNKYDLTTNVDELVYHFSKDQIFQDVHLEDYELKNAMNPLQLVVTDKNIYLKSRKGDNYFTYVVSRNNNSIKFLDLYLYGTS